MSTAGSADELIAVPPGEAQRPDFIIADLRLRGSETGITAIRMLRNHYGQMIPGVIITGDTLPARLKQVHESGLPILHKPLRPAKLRELLGELIAPKA